MILLVSYFDGRSISMISRYKLTAINDHSKALVDYWKKSIDKCKDVLMVKIDESKKHTQSCYHFVRSGKNEILVAGQYDIKKFDTEKVEFSHHFNFEFPLNCFNYACFNNLELLFPSNKKVQVYFNGTLKGELDQIFNGEISGLEGVNTSRGVFYANQDVYFMDKEDKVYHYIMTEIIRNIKSRIYNFHGKCIASNVWYFCGDSNKNRLFFAYKNNTIERSNTSRLTRVAQDHRVTTMHAKFGLLLVCSITDLKSDAKSEPGTVGLPSTIRYYVYDQYSMKPVAPPWDKTKFSYSSNIIEKVDLVDVKLGLMIIAKPNYKFCDLLLLTKRKLTPLAIDKSLSPYCYRTMVTFFDKEKSTVNIWFGSSQGIHLLKISVNLK